MGFEKEFIGFSVSDKVDFTVTFPTDYTLIAGVAGKTLQVQSVIRELHRYSPITVEEFLKKYKYSNLEELRYVVRDTMRRGLENQIFALNRSDLYTQVTSLLSFDVPPVLLENCRQNIKNKLQGIIKNNPKLQKMNIKD